MYLYLIELENSQRKYVGITNNVQKRIQSHKDRLKSGYKSPLYCAMRSKPSWSLKVIAEYTTRKEACDSEVELITFLRELNIPILNLADGGDGGFAVQDRESWKVKLRQSRAGRKPALGMSHTAENKDRFSQCSRKYWETQETYLDIVDEILKLSHKKAKEVYGISTTHYYRLKKRAECNELS